MQEENAKLILDKARVILGASIMQTISIATVATIDGDRVYRAAIGDQQSTGKTAGEALDALTLQIGSQEINGFLLLQSFQPDRFFTAQQQQRLAELMSIWRSARDSADPTLGEQNSVLVPELQSELDALIEAELYATAERSKAILDRIQS
jgi:hypothetical protein